MNDPSDDDAHIAGSAAVTSLVFRHSRTSSYYASSPISTPPTPKLYRSDSSDSSNMNRSPSPVTPSFVDFTGLSASGSSKSGDPSFANTFFTQDPSVANYPPIPSQHAAHFSYPAPPAIAPQPQVYQQGPPVAEQESSSKGPAKQQTKKNHYPCPLAKQYNCSDHFTTSGHAARHAKKHTGKKDAFCPECNKAFTRKDNMEQHRRTHQNGRSSSKPNGESTVKRQKTSKRASTAASDRLQPMQTSMAAPMLDPSLPQSPASSFGFPEPGFAPVLSAGSMHHYPDPMMQFPNSPFVNSSMHFDPALGAITGLDTLAMAAGTKRDEDL